VARKRALRAIDVNSGDGGAVNSRRRDRAGASYDRWAAANETNMKNNRHCPHTIDVRSPALSELPDDIDIVVGSLLCTQFSYSAAEVMISMTAGAFRQSRHPLHHSYYGRTVSQAGPVEPEME
jgi:hypothetical protein